MWSDDGLDGALLDGALVHVGIFAAEQGSKWAKQILTRRFNASVAQACADNNTLPDQWIEAYGDSAERKWISYAQYYKRMENDAPSNDVRSLMVDEKVRELLVEGRYNPQFVFEQTRNALKIASDPALRAEIADNFRLTLAYPDIPIALDNAIKVSRMVIQDET